MGFSVSGYRWEAHWFATGCSNDEVNTTLSLSTKRLDWIGFSIPKYCATLPIFFPFSPASHLLFSRLPYTSCPFFSRSPAPLSLSTEEVLTLQTPAFKFLHGAQFNYTLSTRLINRNACISLPHRISTTNSLETNHFYHQGL